MVMNKKKWIILLAALLLILAGAGSKAAAEDMVTAEETENEINNTKNTAGTLVTAVIEVPDDSGGEAGGDPSQKPDTGDANHNGLYLVMLFVSAGVLSVLVRAALKSR